MIEVKDVNYVKETTAILKGVSFRCESHQVTALIGGSGSGKSTLLKLFLGLITKTSGDIVIKGKSVEEWDLQELRREIGYSVQDGGLFPHLTAKQNVTLVAQFLKTDQQRIEKRLSELADIVGLTKSQLDRYPYELSGGQKQRVSLMRALFLDPAVLFFDEPLSALDVITRSELLVDLKRIFAELKKTVVLVTHDLGEAAFLADKVVLLSGGRVEQQSTIHDFFLHPQTPFAQKFKEAWLRTTELTQRISI